MKIQRAEDVELLLKTNKESQSGIFSNERLLMIKAGIISYFSQVSKKFTGNTKFLQSSGQFPKYTIKANEIDHIELKGGVLSMLFKKSRLISRNEFQDMVRKVDYEPDRSSEISAKEEGSGYVKWTFQSQNTQSMKEFVRLTNFFRSNNPKFQPSLSSLISSFWGQKQKKERQLSMKPAVSDKMYTSDMSKKRMSEVPAGNEGRDLFLESLGILDKKEQKQQPRKSQQITIPSPMDEAAARAELAKQIERKEKQRLKKRRSLINNTNHPSMGIIEQRQNQDKASEMSRNLKEVIVQKKLQIKPSIEPYQQIIIDEKKEESPPPPQVEEKPIQEETTSNLQISSSQIQEMIIDLDKPSTQQNIQFKTQVSIKQEEQPPRQIIQIKQQKPPQEKIQSQKVDPLNITVNSEWKSPQLELKRQKQKKLQQFFKATSYIDHFDPKQICQKLKISMEELQALMKTHSKQEESAWAFIQNNLAYLIAKSKGKQDNTKRSSLRISDEIIKEYYQLSEQGRDENFQFLKMSLQNEISFIKPEQENQYELQAMNWMEQQMQDSFPKQFSSKILNNTHFKIYIRQLQFKRQSISHLKGGWIVNRKGHLEQFLAYLRLEKVVKEISSILTNDIELSCGDAIYLRYKEYEGIAKQWRIGYPCFPIKSIKALEYISKSKEMKHFQHDFPQFNIVTEILQQGKNYRFHLDRIEVPENERHEAILLNELRKLIFPFDNELDLFYNSQEYIQIENTCLKEVSTLVNKKRKIDKEDLYTIMETMENNITVNTLCKLLGCRIDKKGSIFFHHTMLRLGSRQFGEQISLIKRSKKKGNMQLGRQLSKRLMGKLHYYQQVTPISHFIEIYLQIIDFMIVNQNELNRAVSILLKVLSHLGDSEAQQYPIYLALMKAYLKLNQIENFVKCLENCRLLISQMFKQYSPLLDYPLQRIVIMILLKQDINRALAYSSRIIDQIKQNKLFPQNIKERYLSKIRWDRNNILQQLNNSLEAYHDCVEILKEIESKNAYYPDYWIDGVLCMSRCWLKINEVNSINSAELQKRILRALQLTFSRQNLEMVFILFQAGVKVLEKCHQLNLPKILQSQVAFEEARIEFNQAQSEIFYILINQP